MNLDLKNYIQSYPDFPKQGINFRDISPILSSPDAIKYVTQELSKQCSDADIIVGLDARGFLFGILVAEKLGKPFVMIRKKGKLPGTTISQKYSLEYGENELEIQESAIKKGNKISIVDDLLATGGTMKAAIDLIEKAGGSIHTLSCVIALDEPFLLGLESRKCLENYKEKSIVRYN